MIIDIFNTDKKYKIILADPPWSFKTYSDKGKDRSADNHYDIMNIDDIKKMPIKNIADKDCILFLWVTSPCLEQAFGVIKSWGFQYKTIGFNWTKTLKNVDLEKLNVSKDLRMNLGYYTRQNPEMCLLAQDIESSTEICFIGRKGAMLERKSKAVRQAIISPMREHSRKPDEIYERIETLFDGPYIELFARQERKDWDAFGNEVTKFNEVIGDKYAPQKI